jgi:hypothetical protein
MIASMKLAQDGESAAADQMARKRTVRANQRLPRILFPETSHKQAHAAPVSQAAGVSERLYILRFFGKCMETRELL